MVLEVVIEYAGSIMGKCLAALSEFRVPGVKARLIRGGRGFGLAARASEHCTAMRNDMQSMPEHPSTALVKATSAA